MSARVAPSTSIDSSDLSIYREFASRPDGDQEDVIFSVNKVKTSPPSITSAAIQTTFQKLYRWLFGQKKSDIVQDFSAALEAKYGKEVASFAFSQNQKQQALNAGLSKRVIAEVLKNADLARSAQDDIKAYLDMASMNIEMAQRVHPEIDLSELHGKFQKIRDFASWQLNQFEDIAALQAALEEAISVANNSKQLLNSQMPAALKTELPIEKSTEHRLSFSPTTVALEEDLDNWEAFPRTSSLTESDIDNILIEVPDAPITEESLQASLAATHLQHQKVMSELIKRFETHPKALEAQLASLTAAIVQAIQQTVPELAAFAHHIHDDPSLCFHLDANGAVVVRPVNSADTASPLTKEENQKVWHQFCTTLEKCYGKQLLEQMMPDEKREELFLSPLTVAAVKYFFDDIQRALEADQDFLKNQPFLVDDKYYNALLANPKLFQRALEAEQAAATNGTLSIQLARKLFDIGVLTAGGHAGSAIAGGIATTIFTATGVAVPIIPLTFVASVLCSFVAGRIVGSRISSDVGSFTANRAAVYTIGGASTEIASKPVIDLLRDYLTHCLTHITVGPEGADAITSLLEFLLEEGGATIADNLRQACIGSVVNGIDVESLAAPPGEIRPAQAADMDHRIVDLFQTLTTAADQLSPPASHEYELKRPRPHI